jgi:hypothetical protein
MPSGKLQQNLTGNPKWRTQNAKSTVLTLKPTVKDHLFWCGNIFLTGIIPVHLLRSNYVERREAGAQYRCSTGMIETCLPFESRGPVLHVISGIVLVPVAASRCRHIHAVDIFTCICLYVYIYIQYIYYYRSTSTSTGTIAEYQSNIIYNTVYYKVL